MELLPTLAARSRLVFCDEHTLYAARDPHGVRPLVLGRLDRGWVVRQRDRRAGHRRRLLRPRGRARRAAGHRRGRACAASTSPPPEPKGCVFEYVYLARPDTTISGRGGARHPGGDRPPAGRRSTRSRPTWSSRPRSPARRPRSATPRRSGIPYGQGLVKNAYVGRTFIQPSQTIRQLGHPAQAQPAARRHPRQAAGRGGRLDRPRQHPARAGPDAARGRRRRGARPDRLAAGALAVLLRHRLRLPGRADRQRR